VLHVNLESPIRATRAMLPGMLDRGEGHFVYVSSLAGKAPSPRSAMYNASKFGLRGFTLAFRQDLHGTGVGVSIVQPGFVRDLGMFAKTGSSTPGGVRTVSPQQVCKGVTRAIERDLAEVNVAPPELRFLTKVASQFPGFAERVQRLARVEPAMDTIVAAQRESR
jgi:short-subunit dehydrogenase